MLSVNAESEIEAVLNFDNNFCRGYASLQGSILMIDFPMRGAFRLSFESCMICLFQRKDYVK